MSKPSSPKTSPDGPVRRFQRIAGVTRDYAWGTPGGISRVLGLPATEAREAELWLGAHPSAPSRFIDATDVSDLTAWEADGHGTVPFLLKVLSAAEPLSLQAHPDTAQAAAGYAAEEAAGVPRDARERNYKDPNAKPELIVAVLDGFEALCGFRPVEDTLRTIRTLVAASSDPAPLRKWAGILTGPDGVRAAVEWLLTDGGEVQALIRGITESPGDETLITRLAPQYPGDPGVAVALMLNHVTLAAGEALWLAAGGLHAYLSGTGIELMGPSDNVLRGGLTAKHVDAGELARIGDFTPGLPSHLPAVAVSDHTRRYRPADVPSGRDVGFTLYDVTGDDVIPVPNTGIGIVTEGTFTVSAADEQARVGRAESVFIHDAGNVQVRGEGHIFIATG